MVMRPLRLRIRSHSSLRASTSRPRVGSSRNKISGSEIRAMAMLSRRCQPPDSFPALRDRTVSSPSFSDSAAIFPAVSALDMPWMPAISARFSRTLSSGATAVSWGETAMMDFTSSLSRRMLLPFNSASPPLGRVRQESILMVVVLPAPFTPKRENSSPSPMARLRRSTAVRSL